MSEFLVCMAVGLVFALVAGLGVSSAYEFGPLTRGTACTSMSIIPYYVPATPEHP